MFDKMKQIYQMKKMMEGLTSTEDYKGIKITVNGSMKIISLEINDAARNSRDLEKNIVKSANNAMKNIQKKLQKEMKSGNIEMPV
ncbi:YbaB/EbfC family nucleoid-associated protein [bacterium]|nr:YbaB/EbfC family nucleoid-associated protein [bacterium]